MSILIHTDVAAPLSTASHSFPVRVLKNDLSKPVISQFLFCEGCCFPFGFPL